MSVSSPKEGARLGLPTGCLSRTALHVPRLATYTRAQTSLFGRFYDPRLHFVKHCSCFCWDAAWSLSADCRGARDFLLARANTETNGSNVAKVVQDLIDTRSFCWCSWLAQRSIRL